MCVTRCNLWGIVFCLSANTASLLAELVERERRKGHGISVSGSLQEEAQHVSVQCEARERESTCVEMKNGLLLNQREIHHLAQCPSCIQAGCYLSIVASNSDFWTENLASRLHALYPSEPYSTFTITLLPSLLCHPRCCQCCWQYLM